MEISSKIGSMKWANTNDPVSIIFEASKHCCLAPLYTPEEYCFMTILTLTNKTSDGWKMEWAEIKHARGPMVQLMDQSMDQPWTEQWTT